MGIIAAIGRATVYVIFRKLSQNQSSSSIMLTTFHHAFWALLVNLAWGLFYGESQILSSNFFLISSRIWLIYLVMAVLGCITACFVTQAIKLSNPNLVCFFRSADIIVAYLIQVVFFHQPVRMFGVGGSICIIMAIGLLQLEDRFNNVLPVSVKCVF